ncbi:MAG: phosphate acyltransferase PlsX [Dehalococcoidia bacterium]|nr:phosphate acyltransferase PlsX [Dehalococcoidia bacterium]
MRIALDAMGGDHAPSDVVKGGVAAAHEQGIEVVLVGKRSALEVELRNHRFDLPIVDASEVVGFDDPPVRAVRHKQDSSIVVGMNLLKRGDVSALVSAGNSGAVMAAALLILGSIDGVERPALGFLFTPPWPTVLLLDVGANTDCKPRQLVQFAQMGNVYMGRVFGVERPRIGLLSNGEEETKGNLMVRESHRLLKDTNLNFVGNVEGKDIVKGTVDVVVTDGFTGNVVLKANEGLGEYILLSLKQMITSRPHFRIAAFFLEPALRAFAKRLDYAEYGGVPLLGVKGNVIVAHGRSDTNAIKNAIFIAKQAEEQGVVEAMKMGIT